MRMCGIMQVCAVVCVVAGYPAGRRTAIGATSSAELSVQSIARTTRTMEARQIEKSTQARGGAAYFALFLA